MSRCYHTYEPRTRISRTCVTDALASYQSATGAVADSNTGLLRITQEQFDDLESLFFHIGDVSSAPRAHASETVTFALTHW